MWKIEERTGFMFKYFPLPFLKISTQSILVCSKRSNQNPPSLTNTLIFYLGNRKHLFGGGRMDVVGIAHCWKVNSSPWTRGFSDLWPHDLGPWTQSFPENESSWHQLTWSSLPLTSLLLPSQAWLHSLLWSNPSYFPTSIAWAFTRTTVSLGKQCLSLLVEKIQRTCCGIR